MPNPQILAGLYKYLTVSSSQQSPANEASWEVVTATGTLIANSNSPDGWNVSNYAPGTIIVDVPRNAQVLSGNIARIAIGPMAALFDVLPRSPAIPAGQSAPVGLDDSGEFVGEAGWYRILRDGVPLFSWREMGTGSDGWGFQPHGENVFEPPYPACIITVPVNALPGNYTVEQSDTGV